MPKNRVLHARITDDTHEKLTRVCSELDCSVTDYVVSVLDASFDQEPSDIDHEPSTGYVKRISYDKGKTWIDVPELRNICVMND